MHTERTEDSAVADTHTHTQIQKIRKLGTVGCKHNFINVIFFFFLRKYISTFVHTQTLSADSPQSFINEIKKELFMFQTD